MADPFDARLRLGKTTTEDMIAIPVAPDVAESTRQDLRQSAAKWCFPWFAMAAGQEGPLTGMAIHRKMLLIPRAQA